MPPTDVDPRTFRKTLGCFATGVTVVTALAPEGEPVGITISSFTSVSLEPPLILFCLGKTNSNIGAFRVGSRFVVNVLREDQRELSIRFASRMADKWAGVAFDTWESGAPVLRGCLAALECTVTAVHEAGDHLIFIGHVDQLEHSQAGQPLLYFRGAYADLGCSVP